MKIKKEIVFIAIILSIIFVAFNKASASTSNPITLTDPNATDYSSPTLQTSGQTLTGSNTGVTLTNPQGTSSSTTALPSTTPSSDTLNPDNATLNAPTYTTSPTLDGIGQVTGDANTPTTLTAPGSNSCLGLGVKSGDPCTTYNYEAGQCLPYGNSLICVANMVDTSGLGNPTADTSAPAAANAPMNGIYLPNTGLPSPGGGIMQILGNLLAWLLGIVGIIAIISFVISGIQYFAAAGEESKMETAKRTMTYSIIGVIVVLASFVIIQAINFALQGNAFF